MFSRIFVVSFVALTGCSSGLICKVSKDGQLERCLDATQAKPQFQEVTLFETACRAGGHELTNTACPTENVVAACRTASGNVDGVSVAWFYASEDFKTVADVKAECESGELLNANGEVIHVNNGVCSTRSGTITAATFKNGTDAGLTLYLRDDACVETEKGTMAAGEIRGFATYPGDSWTVREGASDANGVIRFEYVTPTTNPGLVTIQ